MRRLALLTALIVSTAASAQTTAPRAGVSPACRTEVLALCPQTDDRAARRQCMMANRDKLSDGCKAEMRAAMEARRTARGGSGDMAAPGAMKLDPQPE